MIITKLKVVNFQAHAKRVIEFHPLVNLIIGDNNYGKTALARAMVWVLSNKPNGSWMRRHDTEETYAELTFTDGTVVRRKLARQFNGYEMVTPAGKLETFNPCGTGVPEPIGAVYGQLTALGVPGLLPVASDVDNTFFMGYTPTARGSVLASLTGAQGLHRMKKGAQVRTRESKVTLKLRQQDVIDLVETYKGFSELDVDEERLQGAQSLERKINAAESEYGAISTALNKYTEASKKLTLASSDLAALQDFATDAEEYVIYSEWVASYAQHAEANADVELLEQSRAKLREDNATLTNLVNKEIALETYCEHRDRAKKAKADIAKHTSTLAKFGTCGECGALKRED